MANISGTNVAARIVPFTTDDEFATHEAKYGQGGWQEVATIVDRDAITPARREAGMAVYVLATSKVYILGNDLTTWTELELGKVDDVQVNGTSVVSNKIASITLPSVIDNLTSTSTSDALSAKQGKVLQGEIEALQGIGRFLSIWNCATGLAETNPPASPYTYHQGDYFIVGTLSSAEPAVNYRPNGPTYTTDVASTTVETEDVKLNDVYFYDGANWLLQKNEQRDTTFSSILGSPYDNTNLSNALDQKQDTLVNQTNIKSVNGNSLLGSGDLTIANNPEITITQGGQTRGSFTLNQSTTETIEIDPGQVIQVSTMPTASEDNAGKIVQWVGNNTENYTNGYFYKCVLVEFSYDDESSTVAQDVEVLITDEPTLDGQFNDMETEYSEDVSYITIVVDSNPDNLVIYPNNETSGAAFATVSRDDIEEQFGIVIDGTLTSDQIIVIRKNDPTLDSSYKWENIKIQSCDCGAASIVYDEPTKTIIFGLEVPVSYDPTTRTVSFN